MPVGACFLCLALLVLAPSRLSAVETADYESLAAELTPDQVAAIEADSRIQLPLRARKRPSEPPIQLLSSRARLALELGARLNVTSVEDCDDESFANRTGAALVSYVRASSYRCLNRLFDDAPGRVRFAAFRAQNMIYVAAEMESLAATYDGEDTDNVAELALFLRTGYYNVFYESENMDWADRLTEIDAAVVAAIDAFVDNDHFDDETDAHAPTLAEVVTLMDASEQQARYIPAAKSWLERWAPRHLATDLDRPIHRFFVMLFRGHWQPEFKTATASDTDLMELLRDFALSDWMLDTEAEYLARNAARELARFSQYEDAEIYPTVRSGVTTILEHYDIEGEGRRIWVAAASSVSHYDDCDFYGICGFEAELEASTLPIQHACTPRVRIRAQNLGESDLLEACAIMATLEARFHKQLRTGRIPVADDVNSDIEVVVFADDAEYEAYSYVFFGNDTNNGGIYLEGDPGDLSNTARFIAYRATWLDGEPIWNLEHELVHYLDGRFNMHGSFADYGVDTHGTVWWLEGLAEYISKQNTDDTAVYVGRSADRRLRDTFDVTYDDNNTAVYRWSYLAARFMFERHRDDVDTILGRLRVGDYDGYRDLLKDVIGSKYDREWSEWLGEVTVSDEETPYLAELPSTMAVEEESTEVYQIALAARPTSDVTITVHPSGNLTIDRTSIAFSTTDWDTAQTVQVTAPLDDNGTHEIGTLRHVASGGGYGYARALVTVELRDNAPEVFFENTRVPVREGGVAELTVRISRPLETATTLRYVLGTDGDPDTADADGEDHDGQDGMLAIPAGESEAMLEISVHDDGDIEPAHEILAVSLEVPQGQLLALGDHTAAVVIEEGVCDRSELIRDELRGSRHCADISPVDLESHIELQLGRRDWEGPLKPGDLSGLTNLLEVRLYGNRLSTLPETVFWELDKLRIVLLEDNNLVELPPRLLYQRTELINFFVNRNQLRTLPPGFFSGLSNLEQLNFSQNPGAPFPLTLEWAERDLHAFVSDSVALVAVLPEGAPFEIRARVAAHGGSVSTDAVVIPAGATESAPITVTRSEPGTARVAFDSVTPATEDRCGLYHGSEGFPCFRGLVTSAGRAATVSFFERLSDTQLFSGESISIPLSRLFGEGATRTFTAVSSDPTLVSVVIEGNRLIIRSGEPSESETVTVTVNATGADGTSTQRILLIAVEPYPGNFLRGWRRAIVEQLGRDSSESATTPLAQGTTEEIVPKVRR